MEHSSDTPPTNRKLLYLVAGAITIGAMLIIFAFVYQPDSKPSVSLTGDQSTQKSIANLPEKFDRSEIVFGCSISKSGHYHTEGRRMIEGYDLWVDKTNAAGGLKVGNKRYPVRIIYYDDGSDKERVRTNITKLIVEDKVDFLLGPFSSGLTLVASAVAEQYGVILLDTCGASEVIFSKDTRCTFAALTSASRYTKDFFLILANNSSEKLTYGVIAKDNLFAKNVAKGARIWAGKYGLQETFYQLLESTGEHLTLTIHELSTAAPDIVVFAGHYRDAVTFVDQLAELTTYQPKAVVMTLGPSQRDFVTELGAKAEYMTGISQWAAETNYRGAIFGSSHDYATLFEKRYGHHPTYQNAQATAGCVIFQLAIEQCDTLNAQSVLENIRSLNTEIFYGKILFDKRGLNIGHPMVVVQIQNGQQRLVWPENATEFELIYPIPDTWNN